MSSRNPFENLGFAESGVRPENPFLALGFAEEPEAPAEPTSGLDMFFDQVVGSWNRARAGRSLLAGARLTEAQQQVEAGGRSGTGSAYDIRARRLEEQERRRAAIAQEDPGFATRNPSLTPPISDAEREAESARVGEIAGRRLGQAAERLAESEVPLHPITEEFLDENSERSGWDIFWDAPGTIIADLVGSSAGHSVEGLAMGAAGGLIAGLPGLAAGVGMGSARADAAATVMSELERRGVDVKNPDAVTAFLRENPDVFTDVQNRAARRAVAVGGFDALSAMFGGKVLSPFKGWIARHGTNVLAQLGIQAGAGAAGEAVGQLAEGRDQIAGREVAAEAIGELGSGGVEAVGAGLAARDQRRREASEADSVTAELERRNLAEGDAGFVATEKDAARAEVAAAGGDLLEQELAAAKTGALVGAEIDSQTQRLARLRERADLDAQRIREQEDYAATQVEEDAARAAIQAEAAANYERQQLRQRDAQAFEQRESDQARTRQAEEAEAVYQREIQLGEQIAAQPAPVTLADVMPAEVRALQPAKKPATIRTRREARQRQLIDPATGEPVGTIEEIRPNTPPRQTLGQRRAAAQEAARAAEALPDLEKPVTAIGAKLREPARTEARERVDLPSSENLAIPEAPNKEQMDKYGRVEEVPLDMARRTQPPKADTKPSDGPLIEGYEDMPVATRLENGEYLINDGHHRTSKAKSNGAKTMPMHVIDAKNYDPAFAGRKPAPERMTDDQLLTALEVSAVAPEPTPAAAPKPTEKPPKTKRLKDRRAERRAVAAAKGRQYRLPDERIVSSENENDEGFVLTGTDENGVEVASMEVSERNDGRLQIKHTGVTESFRGQQVGQQLIERAYRRAAEKGRKLVSDRVVSIHQLRAYEGLKRKGWTIEYGDPAEVAAALEKADEVSNAPDADLFPAQTRKRLDVIGARFKDDTPVVKTIEPPSQIENGRTQNENIRAVPEKVQGVPVADAVAALQPLLNELKGIRPHVLQSVSDAPVDVQGAIMTDGYRHPMAMYDSKTDEIYIFTDNHKSVDSIVKALLHEGVAHKGLRYLLGDQFHPVMLDIGRSLKNNVGFQRIAKKYGYDLTDDAGLVQAADEYAAWLAEKNPKSSVLQKLYDTIRKVLRSLGVVREWTDADINALLRESRKRMRRGTDTDTATNSGELSTDRMQYRLDDEESAQPAPTQPQPLGQLYKVAATMEAQSKTGAGLGERIADLVKNTGVSQQRTVLGAIPRDRIPDFITESKMPAAKTYVRQVRRMDGRRNELLMEADSLGKRWNKSTSKDKANGAKMAELMQASTLAGQHPGKPYVAVKDPVKDAKRRGDYAILRKHWERLSDENKALFDEANTWYRGQRERVLKGLEERIAASRANGQTKKALLAELRERFEAGRIPGYYSPLMRYGDYWAAAKDKNGEMVSFSRFEVPSQQRDWVANMKRQGFTVQQGQKVLAAATVESVSPDFAARVTRLVEKTGDKGLADEIWQAYLNTLPELSMRKAFMHRKGRLGFSANALRAYGHAAFHGAHQIARLENMHILDDTMNEMRAQASKLSNADDAERYWATNIFAEMQDRHEWAKNPRGSAWATALTSFGFLWYLGATPAAALVNLTQTPMVALPVLGAQFGMTKSVGQLAKAGTLWAGSRGPLKNRLRGDERKAFEEAERIGLFDKSQAHDLAGLAEHGVDYSSARRRYMEIASWMFHKAEQANREVTFLAAYRMAREKGATHDAAVLKAEELVWDAHFDYSSTNRPRFVRGDFQKVLFLFKNYSLNMTYRLLRDLNDSVKGATPEQKRQARVRLGGMLTMTGLLAGATGLPLVWSIARVIESMFDDPDDPYDVQEVAYAYLAEQFGPEVAMAIMRGPVDAATGATLSSRIGLQQLWMTAPDAGLETDEIFSQMLGNLAGPLFGVLESAGRAGIALEKTQDPFRALEYLLPKFMKDQLKAYRYLREGALNYRGEAYLEPGEFTNYELFLQSLGFIPSELQQRYDEMAGIRNTEERILGRRQNLMDKYFVAVRNGDARMAAETQAEIIQFNQTNPGAAITSETIQTSAASRRAAAESTVRGVRLTIRNLRGLHEQLRLTEEPPE